MKRRKKKMCKVNGGSSLVQGSKGQTSHCHHFINFVGPICNHNNRIVSSLKCKRYCNKELDILHECSFLCLGMLGHSCCDIEVHVEQFSAYCLQLYNTCKVRNVRYVGFLQVTPKILHRQGFRPH